MKISVVIPAYNASTHIERAIQSVLGQTRPADEIIVVNDGSTDDTSAIVRKYGEKVILIEQPNKGVSIARNVGIETAAGDWIAFLDADDEWLPDKLKLQSEHLRRNPHLSWTTGMYDQCNCTQGHQKAFRLSPVQIQKINKFLGRKEYFDSYFQAFDLQANGHINAMLARKEVLLTVGLFLGNQKIGEDDDLCLRLAYLNTKMGFIGEPLFVYHLGVENRATKIHNDCYHIKFFIERHWELSKQVGMLDEFKICASAKLAFWIRKLLCLGDGKAVRVLIKQYGNLLNTSYRLSTFCGSWFPMVWNCKEAVKRRIRNL